MLRQRYLNQRMVMCEFPTDTSQPFERDDAAEHVSPKGTACCSHGCQRASPWFVGAARSTSPDVAPEFVALGFLSSRQDQRGGGKRVPVATSFCHFVAERTPGTLAQGINNL